MSQLETASIEEFLYFQTILNYSFTHLINSIFKPGNLVLLVNEKQFPPGLRPIPKSLLIEFIHLFENEVNELKDLGLTQASLNCIYDYTKNINTVADLKTWLQRNIRITR